VPKRKLLVLVTATALAGVAAPAGAQQPAGQRTVTAIGTGTARVRPADRHDNASIRKAVEGAQKKALPRALAAAREDAGALAAGTGLTLGDVVSVAETAPSPFGGYYDDSAGSFGPGRYCGRLRVSVLRRIDGRRRRVVRTRRVCRFPSQIVSSVTVTYAASDAQ
jgi:hypothetical protein